jgi:hypothetical protein
VTARGPRPPRQSFVDEAFAAAADAYARAPGSWELAVQAAIAGLFDFLAGRPDQTKACIVDDCGAGPEALARRDRTIDRFVELLGPGFASAPSPQPVVAEAIGGGVYELIRSHVLERRLVDLPDAAPNATVVVLAPFIGASGAIELASSANR